MLPAPANPAPAASLSTVRRPILARPVVLVPIPASLRWLHDRSTLARGTSVSREPIAWRERGQSEARCGRSLRRFGVAGVQRLEHLALEIGDGLLVPRAQRTRRIGARGVVALRMLADAEVLAHDAAIGGDGARAWLGGRLGGVGEIEVVHELCLARTDRIDPAGVHPAGEHRERPGRPHPQPLAAVDGAAAL